MSSVVGYPANGSLQSGSVTSKATAVVGQNVLDASAPLDVVIAVNPVTGSSRLSANSAALPLPVVIFQSAAQAMLSGTTNAMALMPAIPLFDYMGVDSSLLIEPCFEIGGSNSKTYSVRIGTDPLDFSSATTIWTVTRTTTKGDNPLIKLSNRGVLNSQRCPYSVANTYSLSVATSPTNYTIDFAVPQYLFIVGQLTLGSENIQLIDVCVSVRNPK